MASLKELPKKVYEWAYPTNVNMRLFHTPIADRLDISVTHPELQGHNNSASFFYKQVEIDYCKVTFDAGGLVIERKDDKILMSSRGEVYKTIDFTASTYISLIKYYLGRLGSKVETFIVWKPEMLCILPPIQITYCLYIYECPDESGWNFFRKCPGTVKFLSLHFQANPEIMKIPIIAGSRGVIFYGEQTNETLFESKHMYILHNKHIPSMEQLKDVFEYWQLIKRDDGALCFDCPEEIFEEYKKEFESWPTSYTRPRLGIPMRKELSIDFHSGKRMVITGDIIENTGNVRMILAVNPRNPIDSVIDLIERIKTFWSTSTNPAAAKKAAEGASGL